MTFSQTDLNFDRYTYSIQENGVRFRKKTFSSSTEKFITFEQLGTDVRFERGGSLLFGILALLFFSAGFSVFVRRVTGVEVGEGAELFWLCITVICYILYVRKRKRILWLTNEQQTNELEFLGSRWQKKRLTAFLAELTKARDEYLTKNYTVHDGLTQDESIVCIQGGIPVEDGLFLKQLTNNPIRRYEQDDVMDPDREALTIIYSETTEENARAMVSKHRDELASKGKYIFIVGFNSDRYQLALAPTTSDPYTIMNYVWTNGINMDIEPKHIIQKWKKWDGEFGIRPTIIGFDHCECGIVNSDNIDFSKLANEVYEFCPDVVDQGTITAEALAEDMKTTRAIFLWWD